MTKAILDSIGTQKKKKKIYIYIYISNQALAFNMYPYN